MIRWELYKPPKNSRLIPMDDVVKAGNLVRVSGIDGLETKLVGNINAKGGQCECCGYELADIVAIGHTEDATMSEVLKECE